MNREVLWHDAGAMRYMTKSADENAKPAIVPEPANGNGQDDNIPFLGWIKNALVKNRNDGEDLRDAIEEYVEGGKSDARGISSVAAHERTLLSNILHLRDMTVVDVMIPRADIVAIDINMPEKEILSLLSEKQFSRTPVYRDTLDEVVGTIHIKDIMAAMAKGQKLDIADLVREVPIVSPAMHVLDLLLMMKQTRKHMVLVVDEFGGIDGLATIGDLIETIVGEVDDEHDTTEDSIMIDRADGSVLADGRVDVETFEEKYGKLLSEDEREDIDTLGGLVFALAGRIPARGEILSHPSGLVFEVIEADPRRVNRLLIRNIPSRNTAQP